jgi:3'-5' exoribonuclease
LKELLELIFSDKSYLESYLQIPSGKLWHHQYLYGMLEHLVCMLDLSEIMFRHYPEINLELLKTGMITHFLGNVQEFDQNGYINYSREGRLLGHALLTVLQLEKHINQLNDFPGELRMQLYHLIICDKSIDTASSTVLPMTREAISFSNLMRLDIQANAVERIINRDKLEDSDWTKYNNLFNCFIYTRVVTV